ncbi:DEKNAAC101461 [Brettanomyces naardenensis]|uniref:DEKNAAC101461 n=1 Tax=Brettanomyces naardenensis TaxID=13370 RepID=A0A448YHZ7_BRENA|nr:DEKNAAC101461 [Brettanomyces naardenensis]
MSFYNHKLMTIAVICGVGVYTGVKFFEPLVVEQLKKDGNLRGDIPTPEFDSKGDRIIDGVRPDDVWETVKKRLEAKPEDKNEYQLSKLIEEERKDGKEGEQRK